MPDTPDARPVGETTLAEGEARTRLETAFDACLEAWARQHGGMDDGNEEAEDFEDALNAYRDACKAEARAALLRDAPVVFVATEPVRERTRDGVLIWLPRSDHLRMVKPLTPPGTVRRYALVPIEEEETTDGS
jgi:hypothetical protein